jgi:hypothetical protein
MSPKSALAALGFALIACGTEATAPLAATPDASTRDASPIDAANLDASSPDASSPDATTTASAARVRPADVSIAFPLPDSLAAPGLLAGTDLAAHGPLVDPAVFDRLPPLDAHTTGSAASAGPTARAGLRLMALRLDPCFGPVDGSACRAQLRLVFQGLEQTEAGSVEASDGAVHVFVELSTEALVSLTRELLALTAASGGYPDAPLGVHPILAREGFGGPFAAGLRELVLRYAGAERSSRMTFFALLGAGATTWTFGVFDKVGGMYQRETIATTGSRQQSLTTTFGPPGHLSASVEHATTHADDLTLFLDTAEAMRATPEARQRAFAAALRVESPRVHTPDTIDCVSCHTAAPAVRSAEAVFGLSSQGHAERFAPSTPVANPEAATIHNIHAFSYLGRQLAVSTRTANETAVVVEAMNTLLAR